MDVAYSVLLGIALAAGPAAMMGCVAYWVAREWFASEAKELRRMMDAMHGETERDED